jgi:hypothetical protein
MARRMLLAIFRLVFGLLTFLAIGVQLVTLANDGHLDLVNYFSYFTILSNLIGATLLLVGVARWRAPRSARIDLLRGGAVVYLVVTFIVFALLLADTDVDLAIPWVNGVLHEIIPIVVVIDWLIDPPTTRLTNRNGLLWLGFPSVWIAYVLIRGAIVDKYPYPFLDPANGGYATVAMYSVMILALMVAMCAAVVAVGNWARARHDLAAAT